MRKSILAGASALGVLLSSAAAGPLPKDALDSDSMAWFYNRVGATVGEASADKQACHQFAENMTAGTTGAGASQGLLGVLVESVVDSIRDAGPKAAYVDDCMIARGYRRFVVGGRMDDFIARTLSLSPEERGAYVGSEAPPEGRLARTWANSYWIGAEDEPAPPANRRVEAIALPFAAPTHRIRMVRADDPTVAGPNDAVLVLSLRREGPGNSGSYIVFTRDNPETGLPARTTVGSSQRLRWPMFQPQYARPDASGASHFVYIVPAGTYALANSFAGPFMLTQFCLGTVAFTAEPGAVLHLGEYVIRAERGEPSELAPPARLGIRINEPDLDAGRALLARAPEIAARLQGATYTNGFRHACQPYPGVALPVYGIDNPNLGWPASAAAPIDAADIAADAAATDAGGEAIATVGAEAEAEEGDEIVQYRHTLSRHG